MMNTKTNKLLNHIRTDNLDWFELNAENLLSLNQIVQQKYGSSLIHLCAQYDSYRIGQYLLSSSTTNTTTTTNTIPWLLKRDSEGKTPLHTACTFGSIRIARIFLENNNDPNNQIINEFKRGDWTSLMIAVIKQNIQLIKLLLLDYHADDCIRNKDGWTCYHLAIRTGNLQLIQLLFNQKPSNWWPEPVNNGRNLMHIAAINGHSVVFEFLANRLIESNHQELINSIDNCGITPLMDAARIDCLDIFQKILTIIGTKCLEHLDNCQRNLLHHCAQSNAFKTIQFLYDNYPSLLSSSLINHCDHWHQTPLFLAIREGHQESTELLIQFGSRIDQKDINGRTVFDICQQFHNQHLMDLIRLKSN